MLLAQAVLPLASASPPIEPPTEWQDAQPQNAVTIVLPESEVKRRIGLEAQREGDGVFRFGVELPMAISPWNAGDWMPLGPESAWRLRIASPGARSLHLVFDSFALEAGARLYVISESEGIVLGPYTSRDNRDDGVFATPPLPGDSCLLVYRTENHVPPGGFVVRQVVHAYRDVFEAAEAGGPGGNSSTCNIDILCPAGANHQDVKRAVALLIMGGGACSGSLLNNAGQNGSQLFLTAQHCFQGSGVLPGAWTFVFNYERPQCGGGIGSLADAVSGATMLANHGSSDYCLVRIDAPIPPWFDVYFAGFDATGSGVPSANSIHHPCADTKKFNNEDHPLTKTTFVGSQMWFIAKWEGGINEPGSSGSPLFDPTQRVIGQLWGGGAVCGSPINDYYGRLEVAWGAGAAAFLDPTGTNTQISSGVEGTSYLSVDVAASALALPATAELGETIDATFAVDTLGSYPPSSVPWSLWFSVDGVPDPGDRLVASGTTTSFGPSIESIVVPFDLSPGSYFPILRLDPLPYENALLDNDAVGAALSISPSTKPNLSAIAVSLASIVEKGTVVPASIDIAGNAFAPAEYVVEVRLSLDDTVTATDPMLGKITSNLYGPQIVSVTIPASMNVGNYRVGLLVQPAFDEIFESDNVVLGDRVEVVAPPPPKPDVSVLAFVGPAKSKVGKKTKFEITLGTSAFFGEFSYQVRLSPDPIITSEDVLVKSLKSKVSGKVSKNLKIPKVEPGLWYVGVTVDPVAGEVDFTDNSIEGSPITIKPKN